MSKDEDQNEEEELELDFSKLGKKLKSFIKPKKEKKDDEDIDFGDTINFIKENKKVLMIGLIASIILTGIWVRTLSINHYNGQLLGLDPYVFYRYAKILNEQGSLPEVDTYRYFPKGFLTFREHQMNTYFIVITYQLLSPLLGGELIDYGIIYPVIAFAIGIIMFYLTLKDLFNKQTAIIGASFLSFAPSFLFRTISGFADKEPLAMTLWFTMIYFLVRSVKSKNNKDTLINGLLCGLFGGLAGLTWGGAQFLFYSIAFSFLILSLMNKTTKQNLITYYSWYIPVIIMNATMTLRYGGWGLVSQDMFLIPTMAAGLILLKEVSYLLVINKVKRRIPKSFLFAGLLIIISLITIPALQLTNVFDFNSKLEATINTIIHPFGTCPFCVSVTENQAPWFYDPQRGVDWWQRLQYFIPLFIIGSVLLMFDMFKGFGKKSIILIITFSIFMMFFMFSKFVNAQEYATTNAFFANTYLYTLPLLFIVMIIFFIKHPKSKAWARVTPDKLFIISWYALSVIATRGAIRIVFASTPIFIILASYAVTKTASLIKQKTNDQFYSSIPYFVGIAVIIWAFTISSASAGGYWPSFTTNWNQSMNWVKENTSENAVFTHWWDYGYWVQTRGERATTVDGGNFEVKNNEVIGGQLFSGYNMTEVYNSLKYFENNETGQKPNYLLIVDDDVLKYVQMANIGGRPGYYAPFSYSQRTENKIYKPEQFNSLIVFNTLTGPGMISNDLVIDNKLFPKDQSYVINVMIPMNDKQEFGQPIAVLYNAFTGQNIAVEYDCICEQNKGCKRQGLNNSLQDCLLFMNGGVIHIPEHLENRLMTQLYLLNKTIPGFNLVYTTPNPLNLQGIISQQDPMNLKIYKIDYEEMKKWVDNGSPAW